MADRARTLGAAAALAGETIETKCRIAGRQDGQLLLQPAADVVLGRHQVSPITPEPGLQLHAMRHAQGNPAAAVHVYPTPLSHFGVHRPAPGSGWPRQRPARWFDVVDGWRLWDHA